MTLQTVDDVVVSLQHLDNVGGLPVPDEELPVVRARHDELTVRPQEVGLLDVGGGVAGAEISGAVVPSSAP